MTVSEDFDPNEPYVITNKKTAAAIEKLEGEEKSEALREARNSSGEINVSAIHITLVLFSKCLLHAWESKKA